MAKSGVEVWEEFVCRAGIERCANLAPSNNLGIAESLYGAWVALADERAPVDGIGKGDVVIRQFPECFKLESLFFVSGRQFVDYFIRKPFVPYLGDSCLP